MKNLNLEKAGNILNITDVAAILAVQCPTQTPEVAQVHFVLTLTFFIGSIVAVTQQHD